MQSPPPHTPAMKRTRTSLPVSAPPRKKLCANDRKACPPPNESPSKSPAPVCNLEKLLRRLAKGVDFATVRALKAVAVADENMAILLQTIIEHAQELVAERCHTSDSKLLECELYLELLYECEYILTAVENILHAKVQLAVGRTLFTIVHALIDQYISAVDRYQDHDRYSWVMSLVEEANASAADESIDQRSTDAVRDAEALLNRLDKIFVRVIMRFKADSMDYRRLAGFIGMKEETIARSCCLLSEQTGFGDADDMGFGLLVHSREAMLRWKTQGKAKSDDSEDD
ncbi:hypothetical protein C8F01DRAFT_1016213 [Mycena amicta]|nr:hypothetical protein C8F01DRAFT_1016213 [Mycena amicta]